MCIKIRVSVHLTLSAMINIIFTMYIFLRIFKKRELCKNMYSTKMSTFTVDVIIRQCTLGGLLLYGLLVFRSIPHETKGTCCIL